MEQADIETLIGELETRVDRLRSLYEQYFMGIERIVPSVPHKDVERRFYALRREQMRNTALRFRFQNVLLRYNTYQSYWIRICRQIEEGTYKRDVRRANARFAAGRSKPDASEVAPHVDARVAPSHRPPGERFDNSVDVEVEFEAEPLRTEALLPPKRMDLDDLDSPFDAPQKALPQPASAPSVLKAAVAGSVAVPVRKTAAPSRLPASSGAVRTAPRAPTPAQGTPSVAPVPRSAPNPTRVPPPASAVAPSATLAAKSAGKPMEGSLSDERVRQLYGQYVDAKRKSGESTAQVTYEGLAKSLRDSTEKLKQKHGGKHIDFEVAIKEGKAVLRPLVK